MNRTETKKEVLGLTRMTKKGILDLCKKNKLYLTPHLNDVLYLHYQGYQEIECLEEYTGLRCLWLECNAISEISGLENQKDLRCLFLQNNLIKKIENLHGCDQLDTLNLSHNYVTKIENCGHETLPVLTTLNLSHNSLRTGETIEQLINCKTLSVLDISHNRIDDVCIVKILGQMPELRVLILMGNPVVNEIPSYRKTLILECVQLTYLDNRPVFPRDRACAEAWKRGGFEEERRENNRWNKEERRKIRKSVNDTLTLRQRGGGEPHVDLLNTSSDEDDTQHERLSGPHNNGIPEILNISNEQAWKNVEAMAKDPNSAMYVEPSRSDKFIKCKKCNNTNCNYQHNDYEEGVKRTRVEDTLIEESEDIMEDATCSLYKEVAKDEIYLSLYDDEVAADVPNSREYVPTYVLRNTKQHECNRKEHMNVDLACSHDYRADDQETENDHSLEAEEKPGFDLELIKRPSTAEKERDVSNAYDRYMDCVMNLTARPDIVARSSISNEAIVDCRTIQQGIDSSKCDIAKPTPESKTSENGNQLIETLTDSKINVSSVRVAENDKDSKLETIPNLIDFISGDVTYVDTTSITSVIVMKEPEVNLNNKSGANEDDDDDHQADTVEIKQSEDALNESVGSSPDELINEPSNQENSLGFISETTKQLITEDKPNEIADKVKSSLTADTREVIGLPICDDFSHRDPPDIIFVDNSESVEDAREKEINELKTAERLDSEDPFENSSVNEESDIIQQDILRPVKSLKSMITEYSQFFGEAANKLQKTKESKLQEKLTTGNTENSENYDVVNDTVKENGSMGNALACDSPKLEDIKIQPLNSKDNMNENKNCMIQRLLRSPDLETRFSAETVQKEWNDINAIRMQKFREEQDQVKGLIDRVYAQKEKYNDEIEIIHGQLVTIKNDCEKIHDQIQNVNEKLKEENFEAYNEMKKRMMENRDTSLNSNMLNDLYGGMFAEEQARASIDENCGIESECVINSENPQQLDVITESSTEDKETVVDKSIEVNQQMCSLTEIQEDYEEKITLDTDESNIELIEIGDKMFQHTEEDHNESEETTRIEFGNDKCVNVITTDTSDHNVYTYHNDNEDIKIDQEVKHRHIDITHETVTKGGTSETSHTIIDIDSKSVDVKRMIPEKPDAENDDDKAMALRRELLYNPISTAELRGQSRSWNMFSNANQENHITKGSTCDGSCSEHIGFEWLKTLVCRNMNDPKLIDNEIMSEISNDDTNEHEDPFFTENDEKINRIQREIDEAMQKDICDILVDASIEFKMLEAIEKYGDPDTSSGASIGTNVERYSKELKGLLSEEKQRELNTDDKYWRKFNGDPNEYRKMLDLDNNPFIKKIRSLVTESTGYQYDLPPEDDDFLRQFVFNHKEHLLTHPKAEARQLAMKYLSFIKEDDKFIRKEPEFENMETDETLSFMQRKARFEDRMRENSEKMQETMGNNDKLREEIKKRLLEFSENHKDAINSVNDE